MTTTPNRLRGTRYVTAIEAAFLKAQHKKEAVASVIKYPRLLTVEAECDCRNMSCKLAHADMYYVETSPRAEDMYPFMARADAEAFLSRQRTLRLPARKDS